MLELITMKVRTLFLYYKYFNNNISKYNNRAKLLIIKLLVNLFITDYVEITLYHILVIWFKLRWDGFVQF